MSASVPIPHILKLPNETVLTALSRRTMWKKPPKSNLSYVE